MKILVTGGAGFIGSHIVDRLVANGDEVRIYDNLEYQVHAGRLPGYINKKAEMWPGNILDKERLYEAMKDRDAVFHFASCVGVGQSQYLISHYVGTNDLGTANLLDILVNKKHKIKKVILSSSMSMYGEGLYNCSRCGAVKPALREIKKTKKTSGDFWEPECPNCSERISPLPTTEETPTVPNSIYAFTKKHQEEMLMLIGKTYGIPAVALRFFNVYGPRQSLSNPYTGVAAIFLSRIKNNQPPVIYEDGNQTRDFIWVEDVAEAGLCVLKHEKADYNIFNLGTGKTITIAGIAKIINEILGKSINPLITYKFRKGDIRHCYADISKIQKTLGFHPVTLFLDGMRKLCKWSEKVEAEDNFLQAEREMKSRNLLT